MSIVKVIELISEGKTIEAAIESAVLEAAKTLDNIKQVNVQHIEALVDDKKKKIEKYRVNTHVSFVVDRNH